ncbi:hypothetical protein K458DRAFT_482431 [Lentithecium fluviatile CBS 122367]|uniref:NlpC/P60 domain-containing protein n=1 Tax=Lentithecium fluviatile CBS 122367 TaxID=1168545 RepID=A0A6G1JMD1_9PLEO|nr:hypothetical protein K458DRAFT_482431 [Lentithecium fluviatile CBS 122367]
MRSQLLIPLLLSTVSLVNAAIAFPRSVLNGACTGEDGIVGVCVPTKSCTRDNGTYIDNACPGTPEDIKCCTKPHCQSEARSGDCRWVENCGGGKDLVQYLCPGPDAFRCCITSDGNGASSALLSPTGNATVPTSSSAPVQSTTTKPKPVPTKRPELNLGEKILKKAKEAEGIPYHWAGGNCKGTTGGGFDCSGLVSWAVCQVTGRDLFSEGLRVTRSMYCASEKKLKYDKIKWADRRAGDAVFFGGKCDCENNPAGIHHVGLMMDDGYTMWNALKTGTKIRKDNFKKWDESACPYVIRFK